MNLAKSTFLTAFFALTQCFYGQMTVSINTMTVEQYIQNVLLGGGVTISNVEFNGGSAAINNSQVGSFIDANSNIGLPSGFIMGSGDVSMAALLNTSNGNSIGGTGQQGNDSDLQSITPNQIYDECVIEFDFVPEGDTISFNYVFASEEYPEYVCGSVNDAFGFFLTGLNPNGINYVAQNIALIPDPNNPSIYTTTGVSINTVNPGVAGSSGTASNCSNIDPNWASYNIFYTGNSSNTYEYDGSTVVLEAKAAVVCGETYHIKLAIGDGGDSAFDSGVFIEEGSFSSSGINIDAGIANGGTLTALDTLLYEGCNHAFFVFSRADTTTDFTIQLDIGGTATNGFDYAPIADSLVLPIGVQQDTLFIFPIVDGVTEIEETITINIFYVQCMGQVDTVSATLYLNDYTPLSITMPDSLNICPEIDGPYSLEGVWSGGIEPFSYSWSTGDTSSNIISISPMVTQDYSLTISDGCGDPEIGNSTVWVQCPIEEINIFTPNSDGNNDFFIPINIEQYENITLKVFNRWGKIVYEQINYNNDWDGTHYKSGKELKEGVYLYIIETNSEKYEYEDSEKEELKTTLSGYVHLIR